MAQASFEKLKNALTSEPILALPDFDRQFLVYTDASCFCLGVVLAQVHADGKERVISYASRLIRTAECKNPITEKEGLAVIFAVKKYRHYLLGKKFRLITVNSALKALVEKPHLSGRLERWALLLAEFDYEIEYKPVPLHKNADALSRIAENQNDVSDIEPSSRLLCHTGMQFEPTRPQEGGIAADPSIGAVSLRLSLGQKLTKINFVLSKVVTLRFSFLSATLIRQRFRCTNQMTLCASAQTG